MCKDEPADFTQADLVDDLEAIFPGFRAEWRLDNWDMDDMPNDSLHCVWMSLFPFVFNPPPTPKQWKRLADLMSREVAAGGNRENAVDTCALEGMSGDLRRNLRPLLSAQAKKYV